MCQSATSKFPTLVLKTSQSSPASSHSSHSDHKKIIQFSLLFSSLSVNFSDLEYLPVVLKELLEAQLSHLNASAVKLLDEIQRLNANHLLFIIQERITLNRF